MAEEAKPVDWLNCPHSRLAIGDGPCPPPNPLCAWGRCLDCGIEAWGQFGSPISVPDGSARYEREEPQGYTLKRVDNG